MPPAFLRHRSQLAREEAVRTLEASIESLGKLVLNVTALAERLEARPLTDLDDARRRRERVQVLRDAASAGQEAIRRATAHLAGAPQRDQSAASER